MVDTNVARILARWTGRRLTAREAQNLADQSVPSGRVWSWNQTLLDLGALTCTARVPDCKRCPLADRCAWRGEGSDPARGSAGVSREELLGKLNLAVSEFGEATRKRFGNTGEFGG